MEEIVEKIRVAQKEWRAKYPNSHETPWDAIYLEINHRQDGSRYIGFNPSHQQHLNSYGRDVQDFQDWLDGKVTPGGIIRSQESWNELLWICKTGSVAVCIGYEIEHYNLYSPEYLLAPGQRYVHDGVEEVGKGLPQSMQMETTNSYGFKIQCLTPEFIEAVEKHILYLYTKDMEDQLNGLAAWEGKVDIYNVRPSRLVEEEVYGFTFALRALGLETCEGVSNLPAVRENFSWWRCILKNEARWQLWIKHGIAYEPWIQNRKSTYSKYLGYLGN